MEKLLFIVSLVALSSCGIYKYEYAESQMKIKSKANKSIDVVYIMSVSHATYIKFHAKENKHSSEFSIKDFSADYFQCVEGCQFNFTKGERYQIEILPSGDRIFPPIVVEVLQDGQLVQVK